MRMGEPQPRQKSHDVAISGFDIGENQIDMGVIEHVGGLVAARRHDDAIIGLAREGLRRGSKPRACVGNE